MEKAKIDAVKAVRKDICRTIENIESVTSATIANDSRLMKIINEAFEGLSLRGKGVCAERLVREIAKYATGDRDE